MKPKYKLKDMIFAPDKEWKNVAGRKAKLISLSGNNIESFYDYKDWQKRLYPSLYKNCSDEFFMKDYIKHNEFLKYFNGLSKVGEEVQIRYTDRNDVIYLTKELTGRIRLNSDLEVWLWKEYDLQNFTSCFKCEFYSFYSLTVEADSPAAIFEGVGTSFHSKSLGWYIVKFDNYNYPHYIEFTKVYGHGSSSYAKFQIY